MLVDRLVILINFTSKGTNKEDPMRSDSNSSEGFGNYYKDVQNNQESVLLNFEFCAYSQSMVKALKIFDKNFELKHNITCCSFSFY